jgi:hypothetical protein
MILLQESHLYTYSSQRGVTFEIIPLSSYELSTNDTDNVRNIFETLFLE